MEYSDEQRDIIENTNGSVVVSAGAGSGKTRTLVEKIKYDMKKSESETHKIVAAITFTIKATNEIRTRLSPIRNEQVYVSTNNQFVINEIIQPFCKDYYGSDFIHDYDVNYARKFATYDLCLEELKTNRKICSLSNNRQNFVFQLALKILQNSMAAKIYLSSKYYKWYIDEYQDSDNDMHAFFMYVHTELKIDLFIIGDEKQNIYVWRGANSQNFKGLFENDRFSNKRLTENFRSLQQIQNLSNLLNSNTQHLIKEVSGANNVILYPIDDRTDCIEIIIKIVKARRLHTAILRKSNNDVKSTYSELRENGLDFVCVPTIPIDDITSANSWIYFGVAHYCLVNRNAYDFIEYIPVESSEKNDPLTKQIDGILKETNNYKSNENEFIRSFKKLADLLECNVEDDNIKMVLETVLNNDNVSAFYTNDRNNQVSTIHKAKGKEFDLVFLYSSDFTHFATESDINPLYVATTRGKQRLVIFNKPDSLFERYINRKITEISMENKNFYTVYQAIKKDN